MTEIIDFEIAVGEYHLAIFDAKTTSGREYRNLKVCKSKKGHLYIKPPQAKRPEKEWRDLYFCTPLEMEDKKEIYEELKKQGKLDPPASPPNQMSLFDDSTYML